MCVFHIIYKVLGSISSYIVTPQIFALGTVLFFNDSSLPPILDRFFLGGGWVFYFLLFFLSNYLDMEDLCKYGYRHIFILFFMMFIFSIRVDLQCSVNFYCTAKGPSYIYIFFFLLIILHYVPSQVTRYSSLCCTAGSHCLSTPNAIVCIY